MTEEQRQVMTGAQAIVNTLEALGVTDVFGMPGGAILPTYDPLMSSSLHHILVRHEQGAGHAAQGYALASGKVGVAIVTSGPGATNTLTAIADANIDSVPIVVISGQVGASLIGTDAFQEADIVGASMPLAKHSFLVTRAAEIPQRLAEAFHIASTGRPGPVLVDITRSAQVEEFEYHWPVELQLPGYEPAFEPVPRQIARAAEEIARAQAPVLYVGGGLVRARAEEELRTLVELSDAAVVTTLPARGAFPDSDPHNLKMPGMHGTVPAVGALQRADLIVALGARFDDRVTGQLDSFAPRARIVHIDIDLAELSEIAGPEAIYVTGVGQHQMWAAQFLQLEKPSHFISSCGLGTMGYCIPAAMGAQVGAPESVVWAIDGDGSFQMTNQELATCSINRIPIKVALINNSVLGMVRQWQTLFYGERYSNTVLNPQDGEQIPNFEMLAQAYGMAARTVRSAEEIEEAIEWAMSINDRPVLLDFRVSKDAMVWPMVAAGVPNDDIRYARDIAPDWEVED